VENFCLANRLLTGHSPCYWMLMLSILLCNEYCVSQSKTNFTVSESLLLAPPNDCQRAIDIFVRQGWLGRHPDIFERVLGICEQLNDIDNSSGRSAILR